MVESPQNWELTVEEAAKILRVSTRTLRRYVKEGKVDHRRVQGKFGEELRFNEEEIRQTAREMSHGADRAYQEGPDDRGNDANGTDYLSTSELWKAYESLQAEYRNAAAQIGFLKARAEEVPKLAERAESLQKQKEQTEAEKAQLEEARSKLKEELQRERQEKERLRRQMMWGLAAYFTVFLLLGALLVLFSPSYSTYITQILNLLSR
jgi:excisionase family DNA binding protein